jgi:FSR family fosmidomycin resistance protein-like MFS transporter
VRRLIVVLLAIEFLDELAWGVLNAAWPLVREDLTLSYAEIGVLLSVPFYASAILEPVVGVLGDTRFRRSAVLAGGLTFALALAVAASAPEFVLLLVALCALSPASGAFVSLSQATLMDLDPDARERNMARWTLAGSVGVVAGPLLLAVSVALGGGWRTPFAALAVITLVLTFAARALPAPSRDGSPSFRDAVRATVAALRRLAVIRWLVLLELSDLMLDVFGAFLALYLVDAAGLSTVEAGLGFALWTGAGLLGDALLLPVLRRISGLSYLRASALLVAVLFPMFLLLDSVWAKLALLAALGLLNSGWYAIPKARLYAELPGQSGAVLTLGTVTGLVGGTFPLAVGLLAGGVGIDVALWALLAAPIALLVGLPRR